MTMKAASTAKPKPASAVIDKLLPGEGLNKPISRTITSVESVNKQNIAKSATIPVAAPIVSEGKQKAAAQKSAKKIDKQATVDRPAKEKLNLMRRRSVIDKRGRKKRIRD
ncbi:hypothetical protein LSTR_LSTR010868 [Laodelphax striatellus]|uniref:Uncharacterized protein n=1 Tax=Laodelphax striatellus TaxID=195883 RepID=A0A482WPR6_LAOST|nr:hypothetical protein LSTR_LSTR010868 [Laodelphax striatellus]